VGLGDEDVDATLEQRPGLVVEGHRQIVEGDRARARVVDVGRERRGLGGRAERAGDEARATRMGGHEIVDRLARDPRRGQVDRVHLTGEAVVLERHRRAGEAVGLDDVGAGCQEGAVDVADDVGAGDREDVAAPAEGAVVVAVALAVEVCLLEPALLDHGAHGPVHDQNAAGHGFPQPFGSVHGHVCTIGWRAP
jgi:hypothetical protein